MRILNDLVWYAGTPLFLVVMVTHVCGLVWFDMPTNSPFIWAWHWLTIPILAGVWSYALTQRDYFRRIRRVSRFRFWFATAASGPLLLLFSGGIVAILNCAYANGTPVSISGTIRELNMGRGRYGDFHIATIAERRTSSEVKLDISASEFAHLSVGQNYQRDMLLGRLGIPYRPRR